MDKDGKTTAVHEERRAFARRCKLDNVGWHTFRHTYRSWLDDDGAPIGVQQKLMRHSDIATTAKYGDAVMDPSASTTRSWFAGLWGTNNLEGTAAGDRHPKSLESSKS